MRKLLAVLVLIGTSVPAMASNWIFVGSSVTQSKYYFDATSIRKINEYGGVYWFVWVKIDSHLDKNATHVVNRSAKIFRHIAEIKQSWHIRCETREMRVNSVIQYDIGGKVIFSDSFSSAGAFEPVAPDTVGEAVVDAACGTIPADQ